MAGQHFTGQNLIGYDNYKKRYVGTAVNSGSTSIMFSEGTADADGKTITLEWEDKDQDAAHPFRTRIVTKIIDKDVSGLLGRRLNLVVWLNMAIR